MWLITQTKGEAVAKQKSYLVTWTIDIEAENEVEAAKQALQIQREVGGEATYFEVKNKATNETKHVDLNVEGA